MVMEASDMERRKHNEKNLRNRSESWVVYKGTAEKEDQRNFKKGSWCLGLSKYFSSLFLSPSFLLPFLPLSLPPPFFISFYFSYGQCFLFFFFLHGRISSFKQIWNWTYYIFWTKYQKEKLKQINSSTSAQVLQWNRFDRSLIKESD